MDWKEINFIIEAIEVLLKQYEERLAKSSIIEEDNSELANDIEYLKILLGHYQAKRDELK